MAASSLAVTLSRQRWLPYKTRRSLIKRLYPAMLKDFPFEAEFFDNDGKLRFRGNIINYIDRLVYFCGAHEKYMLRFLRDYVSRLPAPVTVLDIGANAGNHSLFMSNHVASVHAFEPYPRVRQQLEENLAINHINNVSVHPFGLGNENATLPFYAAPDSNLGAASFRQDHKQDNYYLGDMQIRRGDDVVTEFGIWADIIKADVEGYEKLVLEGLQKTLRRTRPLLVIELSPTTRESIGSPEAFKKLFPERYNFYYFSSGNYDTGHYRLAPFEYHMTPKIQDVIACPEEKPWLNKAFGVG
jgi:FkbM family methyltransferase